MKQERQERHSSEEHSEVSITKLFPNFITTLGLCFGISSIKLAMLAKFEMAVVFLFMAAIIDVLDGGVARMLNAQSKFGEMLDSLSDFINFGFCPIFIVYLWNLHSVKFFGWACVLLCVISTAIRLARFNTQIDLNNANPVRKKFFFGVPAPASAILVCLPLILSFEFETFTTFIETHSYILVAYIAIVSVLTASTIPTISLKGIKIKESLITPVMILMVIFVIALFMEKWKTILFCAPFYMVSIPLTYMHFHRLTKKHESA